MYNLQVTKKQNRLIEVKAESAEKSLEVTERHVFFFLLIKYIPQ